MLAKMYAEIPFVCEEFTRATSVRTYVNVKFVNMVTFK